ncbi:uncharacterized protein [Primulina eburnea]|uniref:uncharacterized protein isoform X2 n=1 Tax=Primulina eburnea TaxID=1245227 RepID=UPI003C6C6DA0
MPHGHFTCRMLAGTCLEGSDFSDISLLTAYSFFTSYTSSHHLVELKLRDLSNNIGLTGNLPPSIGSLMNLTILLLVGCSFSGPIPDSIGSLPQLVFLSLNSNSFTGSIPPSIRNLSRLSWLNLSQNKLTGTIPVSNETASGLDKLLRARHFHLSVNQFPDPPLINSSVTIWT